MSDALSYHFWNSGIVTRNDENFEHIEANDDGVIMHLESGKKNESRLHTFCKWTNR